MEPNPTSVEATPEVFLCPITRQIMRDPVMDRDGYSYERSAIEAWVRDHGTSPMTRSPLTLQELVPNRSLRNTIEENHEVRHILPPPPDPTATPDDIPAVITFKEPPRLDVRVERVAEDSNDFLVRVVPPEFPVDGYRAAVDLVCVVDTSGSMSSDATVQDNQGRVESHGINVLDIVKHAVRSVAGMLGPQDRLAIVAFSDKAKIVLPFTSMTAVGKKEVKAALDALSPGGCTNLWDGQQTAMDLLRSSGSERNGSILLLTDGLPTNHPPRGHLPTLRTYYEKMGKTLNFSVHTFGFGYSLMSDLLNDIAQVSNGLYVFIPDAGLVGTVFINTVANLLSTVSPQLYLEISVAGTTPTTFTPPLTLSGAETLSGSVGAIQFGQTRTFYVKNAGPMTSITVRAEAVMGKGIVKLASEKIVPTSPEALQPYRHRLLFGQQLSKLVDPKIESQSPEGPTKKGRAERQQILDLAIAEIRNDNNKSDLSAALLEDLTGQVSIAVGKDEYYNKWGVHYIPSLVRANVLEQCNNFKDKSVGTYGGAFFKKLCDQGEAVFLKVPPPESKKREPVQISNYYNVSGGCVAGHCEVLIRSENNVPSSKRFDALRPGDVLTNGAIVHKIARIALPAGSMMVRLPGHGSPEITPYHPVRPQGSATHDSWSFPINVPHISTYTTATETFVYAVVLSVEGPPSQNSFEIPALGGFCVVAWGHGLSDNDVVAHHFFGSHEAVLGALAHSPQYNSGVIDITDFVRETKGHRIVGLKFNPTVLEAI